MKNKKNEFKVGDYIYYIHNKEYGIGKVGEIKREGDLYGYWSRPLPKLPKTIEEFNKIKRGSYGFMPYDMVEKLELSNNTNAKKSIEHIINGNKTIVIIHNEEGTYSKGISRCNPEDKFNEFKGFVLAYGRALLGTSSNIEIKFEISDFSNEDFLKELNKRLIK